MTGYPPLCKFICTDFDNRFVTENSGDQLRRSAAISSRAKRKPPFRGASRVFLLLQIPGTAGACVSNNFVFCCPSLPAFDTVIEIGFVAFDFASSYDWFWLDHFHPLSLSNSKTTTQPKSCQVYFDNRLITLASCFELPLSCASSGKTSNELRLSCCASCAIRFLTSNEQTSPFDPAPVQASPADRPARAKQNPQPFG